MTKRVRKTMRSRAWIGAVIGAMLLGASASQAATLTVGTNTINGAGASANVPITVDDPMGIDSADLTITYDPAIVTPSTPVVTGDSSGCLVSANMTAPGTIRVAVACGTAPTGPNFLDLPLQGVAPGTSAITITTCSLVEDSIPCMKAPGSVTVLPPTPTATRTFTSTATPTRTATGTNTATNTRTATSTATVTRTPTVTNTPSSTPTRTFTRTSTPTRTGSPTATAAFGAPTITSPSAGAVIAVSGISFAWTAVAGATGYDLRITNASAATVFSGSLTGNGATSTLISLPQNGNYTVNVRACNGATCSAFASRAFSVALAAPSAAPTIVAPANGAVLTSSVQSFSWTAVTGVSGFQVFYEVRLTNLTSGQVELQITVPDPTLSTVTQLRSANYRLQVRACQIACGPFGTPSDFSVNVAPVPTSAPTITSATLQSSGNALDIAWTAVSGAEWYQLYVIQPTAGPGGSALTVAARQVVGTSITGLLVPAGNANAIVAACTGNGCGPFSGARAVSPNGGNPAAPQLGTPLGGSVVDGSGGVTFTWSRVPGDVGGNTSYRLYVQDLSRQSTALDIITTENFFAAYLRGEGSRYDALVVARPGTAQETVGPTSGFTVRGATPPAPTMVAPTHNSTITGGNVTVGWTPITGASLYEYYVAAPGVPSYTPTRGVTPGLVVQVPLLALNGQPTLYSSIVRACPSGATCQAGSETGWGPWSNVAGTGVTNFTVTP